jgi:hypothetical protein
VSRLFSLLSSLRVYWLVGLQNDAGKFFTAAGTLIMLDFAGSALGTLLATIFPNLQVALAASPMGQTERMEPSSEGRGDQNQK